MSHNCVQANDFHAYVLRGEDGITFTPHIDENYILSWENDGGLPNPPAICLRDIVKDIVGADGFVEVSDNEIDEILKG